MKKIFYLLILVGLIEVIGSVGAFDYSLNSAMWGNKTGCAYDNTGEPVYKLDDISTCCLLLPTTGVLNLTIDFDNTDSAAPTLTSYNCSTGCSVITSTGVAYTGGTTRKQETKTFSTNTGLICFLSAGHLKNIWPATSYVTMIQPDYSTYRNFSSGNTYGFLVPSYANRMALSLDGEIIGETSANNDVDYKVLNITIPSVSTGLTYFSVNSWNSSDPTDDSETSTIVNLNACPDGKVLSKYPVDQTFFLTKGQNKTLFVLLANYSDDIVITFYDNGAVKQEGDKTAYTYTYTGTTSGRHILQMSAYSPSCNTWVWASWYAYVEPDITVKGTCSCNSNKVQVFPICFRKNDSTVYKCTGSTEDGLFTIDLPPGMYNVSVDDRDYVYYNSTLNVSIPEYQTTYPIYQYTNIELVSKNITGERVIDFKTDGGCDSNYNDDLKNVSFYLYTSSGVNVFGMSEGVVNSINDYYLPNYTYDGTTLNLTILQGDYTFEVGKTGYFPMSSQDNTLHISVLNSNIFGYSQSFTYFLENLTCNYSINYTVYSYTNDSTSYISLPGVKLDFYDYFTGDYVSTGYTDTSGKYQKNNSEKYQDIRATKYGYSSDHFKGEIVGGENVSVRLKIVGKAWNISGFTYDCVNNLQNSLSGVSLTLTNKAGEVIDSIISDSEGYFNFVSVPEGDYVLNMSKYGYGSKTVSVPLYSNWYEYSTLCIGISGDYCRYSVYAYDPNNTQLSGLPVNAYEGVNGALISTQDIDEQTGYTMFTLPRVYGDRGNEVGYSFEIVNSGYYDENITKTYTCLGGKATITKYLTDPSIIPFDEKSVISFIEKYMWGIFLIILLLFCLYIGVLMAKGIGIM